MAFVKTSSTTLWLVAGQIYIGLGFADFGDGNILTWIRCLTPTWLCLPLPCPSLLDNLFSICRSSIALPSLQLFTLTHCLPFRSWYSVSPYPQGTHQTLKFHRIALQDQYLRTKQYAPSQEGLECVCVWEREREDKKKKERARGRE